MSAWTLVLLLIGIALIVLAGRFRQRGHARRAARPALSSTMETLSECLERLEARGYVDQFRPDGEVLRATGAERSFRPESLRVDAVQRFEGMSSPDDASVVYALSHAESGVAGTFVTSFGPGSDPDTVELVRRLPERDPSPRASARGMGAVLVWACLVGGALLLAPDPVRAEAGVERHAGEIRAVDAEAGTLELATPDGITSFRLTPRTRVADATHELGVASLAAGATVRTQAVSDSRGRLTLDYVQIIDPREIAAGVVVSDLSESPAFAAADTATVTAWDEVARELRVDTRDGPRSYRLDASTRIQEGGRVVADSVLAPGVRVVVTADRRDDGYLARDVTVVSRGPEPPATTTGLED